MELFRISRAKYADMIVSSGKANRWNKGGQNVVYAGSSRSLSTLELIVHGGIALRGIEYKVLVISVLDFENSFMEISASALPENWRRMSAYPMLQEIGSQWYEKRESLILQIPSAVIPQEYNFMINLEHDEYQNKVQLKRIEDYFWDHRLL